MKDDFPVYFPLSSGRLVKIERPYSFDKGEGPPAVEFVCGVHSDLENSLKRAFHECLEIWQKGGKSTDFLASKQICIDLICQHKNDFRDVRGESAGLALAIALLVFFFDRPVPVPIVATGKLGRGRVEPVEDLEAKLSGALEAMPQGTFFFYPAGQNIPESLSKRAKDKKIRLIGVHTLSEVLEHLGFFSPNEASNEVSDFARFPESKGKRRIGPIWLIALGLLVLLGGGSFYYFFAGVRAAPKKGLSAPKGSSSLGTDSTTSILIEASGTWEKRVKNYLTPQLKGLVKSMDATLRIIRIVADFEPSTSSLLALRLEIKELECISNSNDRQLPTVLVVYSQGAGPLASRVPELAGELKRRIKELCSSYNSGRGFD